MNRRTVRWSTAVAWILILILARFHIRQIVDASILYDDAFISSVAKNVAFGFGYSTSFHEIDLFDPEISTGPSIVIPTAILIRLLGNRYWVPNLSITVAFWAAFACLALLLRRRVGERLFYSALIFLTAGLTIFGTAEFGLLGELPGSLLVAASFALLTRSSAGDRGPGIAAGVGLGIALYCKLIAAFAIPAVVIVAFVETRSRLRGRKPNPLNWRRVGACFVGFALPVVAWEVYQIIAAWGGPTSWIGIKGREFGFLTAAQSLSGIDQLAHPWLFVDSIRANLPRNLAALSGFVGGWLRLLPAVVGLAAMFAATSTSDRADRRNRCWSRLLLCAALLHFCWWAALSATGWYRHLLPALIYTIVLGAILTAGSDMARRVRLVGIVSCCLTAVLLIPVWLPRSLNVVRVWDFKRDERLLALVATADELTRLQTDRSVVLIGCGWWVARDLEYMLPAVNNFKDCFRLRADEIVGKRLLLVRNEYFNWEKDPRLERYEKSCAERVLYRRDPFVVTECSGLPAQVAMAGAK